MCVHYRHLNQLTIKDAYPLPRIEEIFTSLHNAYCFVAFDLLMGYHHIPVREADRPISAFITHKGLYVFTVMPFGLCNAPASFQPLMYGIFRDQIGIDLAAYLNDLLMYAQRHTVILHVLHRTLGQFIDAGKPRKCQIFTESIPYLGTLSGRERFRRIAANWTSSVNGRLRKQALRWHPSSACVTIIDA